jgi:trigger factor
MNITVTTKESDGVGRTLHVSVPVEEVTAAENAAARKYASQARLPGFRPGKAPAAVVRKKFSEAIRHDALDNLVQAAFKEIVERENIKIAGQPQVNALDFAEGKPLTFDLHLEVLPEINLQRLTGFRVTRSPVTVTDAQVTQQIDHLREQKATWAPVDDIAMPGNIVKVMLSMSDQKGGDIGEHEYNIKIGTNQAIPGIESLIMDTAPGETKERPVRWPDDFPDAEQRGQTKVVRARVLEVKRRQLPELDDSFAREVGDFETVEELRNAVRGDLQLHGERAADSEARQQLLDEIVSANRFDVPKVWVAQLVRGYAEQYQVPESDLDKFAAEVWPAAERQVRRELVIERIAEQESLKATESDIDLRISEVAAKRNTTPASVYGSLQKGGRMKELEKGVTDDKVFAWLLERNTIE